MSNLKSRIDYRLETGLNWHDANLKPTKEFTLWLEQKYVGIKNEGIRESEKKVCRHLNYEKEDGVYSCPDCGEIWIYD
ncbi:MAG: hypothetical protein ACK5JD_11040 [Mangrovibacterium sp.]